MVTTWYFNLRKMQGLLTLLYSTETYTLYPRYFRKLSKVHLRHLRQILRISWKDHIPNVEALRRAYMSNIVDHCETLAQDRQQRKRHIEEKLSQTYRHGHYLRHGFPDASAPSSSVSTAAVALHFKLDYSLTNEQST